MKHAPYQQAFAYLPHEPPIRFVKTAELQNNGELLCAGSIPEDSGFVHEGEYPAYILLEFAAQAAAIDALERLADRDTPPRVGYLVRVQGVRWRSSPVKTSEPLTARIKPNGAIANLFKYSAAVEADEQWALAGDFSIYIDLEETAD